MDYLKSLLLCSLVWAIACNRFPRDAAHTLEKVQNHELLVGISINDSAHENKRTSKAKSLLEAYAAHLHSKIVWVPGLQSELAELIKSGQIQLAAAGFDKTSVFKKEVAFSKPFFIEQVKIGAPANFPMPDDVGDKKVYVSDRLTAAWVEKKKGIPVFTGNGSAPPGLYAGTEEELQEKHLQVSGITLHKTPYVIALPKGENALLMDLETFIDQYGK